MILLLFLSTCFCVGFSYREKEEYGNTHRMSLHRKAESIEFTPLYNSDAVVLWRRNDPPISVDHRRKVKGTFYVIYNLTQEDSGRYVMRDKNRLPLYIRTIKVVETTKSYVHNVGESFSITFNLDPTSCNIYFLPESSHDLREITIVRNGRLQENSYGLHCVGFELLKPCGISNSGLQMSCRGHYEVRDQNGNKALVAHLEMESGADEPSAVGIGIGIFSIVFSCCICLKWCCCKKRSSKEDRSETPSPAEHYQEYDHEPAGGRSIQHSPATGTHYSAQPSTSQTGPLIHTPPTLLPPAYSKYDHEPVRARSIQHSPATGTHYSTQPSTSQTGLIHTPPTLLPPTDSKASAPIKEVVAPTFPVLSDSEPRFELEGLTFTPLSSDATCSDVYTSDKLNFQ